MPLTARAFIGPGLTAEGNRLYLGGQGGALACVNGESGGVEWISVIEEVPDSAKPRPGIWDGIPVAPVVVDGSVVVPPGVGRSLVAVSSRTGKVLKSPGSSTFGRTRLHTLAVAGNRLIAIGADGWSLVEADDRNIERSDRVKWFGIARGGLYAQRRNGDRERIVRWDPETGEEVHLAQVPPGTRFTGVAIWEGRLILVDGQLARTLPLHLEPAELMSVLADLAPQDPADLGSVQARERQSAVGVFRLMWRREGAGALRSLEELAAAALKEADGEVRLLVDIAARFALTTSAGRGDLRVFRPRAVERAWRDPPPADATTRPGPVPFSMGPTPFILDGDRRTFLVESRLHLDGRVELESTEKGDPWPLVAAPIEKLPKEFNRVSERRGCPLRLKADGTGAWGVARVGVIPLEQLSGSWAREWVAWLEPIRADSRLLPAGFPDARVVSRLDPTGPGARGVAVGDLLMDGGKDVAALRLAVEAGAVRIVRLRYDPVELR